MPASPATQLCTVTVQTASLLGNIGHENTRTTLFRKTPLGTTDEGWLYKITITNFEQTEQGELAQLEADTMELRRELIVETSKIGQLQRVTNKAALRQQWAGLRPRLLHKYRGSASITPTMIEGVGYVLEGDGYLESILNDGYEFNLLFPSFYGQTYSTEPIPTRNRIIPRFFGDINLTFQTRTYRKSEVPPDVETGLVVTGYLDEKEYPAEAVQNVLRKITDEPNLDTTLNAQHFESYEFDAKRNLINAAQFTIYGVEGVLFSKTTSTLQAIAG